MIWSDKTSSDGAGALERDLGTVELKGPPRAVAGRHATYAVIFRAGFYGVDDSGAVKLSWRFASDAGTPQFDDPSAPNYCSARASNGIGLRLRYDAKGNVRPWGKTITVTLVGGCLVEGDSIVMVLGETAGGSPGWRMQTFCERAFRFKLFSDRHATRRFEEVGEPRAISVIAGAPVRKVFVAPTTIRVGEPFHIRFKSEDCWGNPAGETGSIGHPGYSSAGVHRPSVDGATCNPVAALPADDDRPPGRFWADLHGQSAETIGTGTVEEYFAFARDRAFLDVASHQGNDFQVTDSFWKRLQEVTRAFCEPGRFVTFPGYEYSANTGLGGDHNVLYREEGPEAVVSRSCRALVPDSEAAFEDSPTIEDLYRNLEGRDAIVIAHVGGRHADASRDSGRDKFAGVEVHSAWGTFEWLLREGLERGDRVAVFANSDDHKGRPGASHPGASMFGSYGGLTCILADGLDRESVWKAIRARHVYATTGARMYLDVRAGGAIMGDVTELKPADSLVVTIAGCGALERAEVLAGRERLFLWRPAGNVTGRRLKLTWEGAERRGRGRACSFDGGLVLDANAVEGFVPVNFWNPEKRLELTAPDRLAWRSVTTGGTSGVVLTLREPRTGRLSVRAEQGELEVDLAELDDRGASVDLGGVEKRISVRWLPDVNEVADAEFSCELSGLGPGEHPVYVKVVQEDGHMAWSSPVYCQVGGTEKGPRR